MAYVARQCYTKKMNVEQEEVKSPKKSNARNVKFFALRCLFFLIYLSWAADSGNLPDYAGFLYDFRYGDKAGHFVLYGGVAFFLSLAFPRTFTVWRFHIPYVAIFFLLFALGEEWSQNLFPRRTPDFLDAACSALGIILGSWAAGHVKKRP